MTVGLVARVALAVWLIQPAIRLVCAEACFPAPAAAVETSCHESAGDAATETDGPVVSARPPCVDLQFAAPGPVSTLTREVIAGLEPSVEVVTPWIPAAAPLFDRTTTESSPPPLLRTILRI